MRLEFALVVLAGLASLQIVLSGPNDFFFFGYVQSHMSSTADIVKFSPNDVGHYLSKSAGLRNVRPRFRTASSLDSAAQIVCLDDSVRFVRSCD